MSMFPSQTINSPNTITKKVGESKNETPKIKLPKLKKITKTEGAAI